MKQHRCFRSRSTNSCTKTTSLEHRTHPPTEELTGLNPRKHSNTLNGSETSQSLISGTRSCHLTLPTFWATRPKLPPHRKLLGMYRPSWPK